MDSLHGLWGLLCNVPMHDVMDTIVGLSQDKAVWLTSMWVSVQAARRGWRVTEVNLDTSTALFRLELKCNAIGLSATLFCVPSRCCPQI